jgi:deoxyribose-phosphate aldolase
MKMITSKDIAKMIDHSLLKPEVTVEEVRKGCIRLIFSIISEGVYTFSIINLVLPMAFILLPVVSLPRI